MFDSKKRKGKLKKKINDGYRAISDLYHSNRKNFSFGDMLLVGSMFVLMALFFGFLSVNSIKTGRGIAVDTVVCIYFLVLCISVALLAVFTGFYACCSKEKVKRERKCKDRVFIILYIVYLLYVCILLLPSIIAYWVINRISTLRAKRYENIQRALLLFAMNSMLITIILSIQQVTNYSERLFYLISKHVGLDEIPTVLFVLMGTIEIAMIIFNMLYFYFFRLSEKRKTTQEAEKKREEANSTFLPSKDIAEHMEAVQKMIDELKLKRRSEWEYDRNYLRNCLTRFHIILLIVVFFAATFSNSPDIVEIRSDLVNVVASFTLIILYFDKRNSLVSKKKEKEMEV